MAAAFALELADEVRDVFNVREEREVRETRECVPTFDTLSTSLICVWKEIIILVVSILANRTSTLSCKSSTW